MKSDRTLAALCLSVLLWSPLLAEDETTILRASDGVFPDNFGAAVDIDGPWMVVGTPFDDTGSAAEQGAVYLFEADGSGGFTEFLKILAPDGAAFDQFGKDVAISGDTIVVGAIGAAIGGNSSEGAAYVFQRDQGGPNSWGMVKKLLASTNVLNLAEVGGSVAIDGDTIAVGARTAYNQANGAVFLYERDEGGTDNWGVVQDLQDDLFDSNASFGVDVAIDGDVLVVGAENLDQTQGSFDNEGGIYIFTRNGGTWSQSVKLYASNFESNARLGESVAIDGDVVAAGARFADASGFSSSGTAYVFEKTGPNDGDWTETRILGPDDPGSFTYFGAEVAVRGDIVIVGATSAGTVGEGKGYRFDSNGGLWNQTNSFTASDGASGDTLGAAIKITPTVIALGSPIGDEGAVYLYPAGPAGPGSIPTTSLRVDRSPTPGRLVVSWEASCGRDGDDYGVYEGTLGVWYSHSLVTCADLGDDLSEDILPDVGDQYYFVVPNSATEEGAYGRASDGSDRPVGQATCAPTQSIAVCP